MIVDGLKRYVVGTRRLGWNKLSASEWEDSVSFCPALVAQGVSTRRTGNCWAVFIIGAFFRFLGGLLLILLRALWLARPLGYSY